MRHLFILPLLAHGAVSQDKFVRSGEVQVAVNEVGQIASNINRKHTLSGGVLRYTAVRKHNNYLESNLTEAFKRTQDAFAEMMMQRSKLTYEYLTIQGTCHSYSDVTSGSRKISFLDLNAYEVDVSAKTVTVAPGVRFMDLLATLKANKLSFAAHGDYAGQTIIGAVSTGTHGHGLPAAHNYVAQMIVVTGDALVKNLHMRKVTSQDSDFGAWVLSLGSLGVILQLQMKLVDDFLIKSTERKLSLHMAIDEMTRHKFSTFDWLGPGLTKGAFDLKATIVSFRKSVVLRPGEANATLHKCCFGHLPFQDRFKGQIFSYNDDFVYDPMEDYNSSTSLCDGADKEHHAFGGVDPTRLLDDGYASDALAKDNRASFEMTFPAKQLKLACEIFAHQLWWPSEAQLHFRWISVDTLERQTILLSSFRTHDRISVEVVSFLPIVPWFDWLERYENLIIEMRKKGVDVHHHRGKTKMDFEVLYAGGGDLIDPQTEEYENLDEFMRHKQSNDPQNIFSNEYVTRLCRHVNATFCS